MAALITLAELKTYLRIATSDTGKDAILTALTTEITAAISAFLKWDPAAAVDQEKKLDGDGSTVLDLGVKHVTAVASVTIEGTLVDASYYEWYENGLIKMVDTGVYSARLRSTGWLFPTGAKNITVVYSAGYSTIPDDLKLGCKMWCSYILNRRGEEAQMNVSDAANNTTVTTLTKLPDDVRQLLKPYRKSFMRVI